MSSHAPRLHAPLDWVATNLRAYGEEAVASAVVRLSPSQIEQFERSAGSHAATGMPYARAVALAAVEIVEGAPRALKRKRRLMHVYRD
jgi:hypothetical protein